MFLIMIELLILMDTNRLFLIVMSGNNNLRIQKLRIQMRSELRVQKLRIQMITFSAKEKSVGEKTMAFI